MTTPIRITHTLIPTKPRRSNRAIRNCIDTVLILCMIGIGASAGYFFIAGIAIRLGFAR